MKALVLAALMIVSTKVFAKTGVNTPLNSSPVQVTASDSNFRIESISLATVASAVKFDPSCAVPSSADSDSSAVNGCLVPTATVKAVQVIVSFDTGEANDDNRTQQVEVNLPVSLFTASELAQIQANRAGGLDPLGKKTRRNQALANSMLQLNVEKSVVSQPVVECVKGYSDSDDGPVTCDQYATTGSQLVSVHSLYVTRR